MVMWQVQEAKARLSELMKRAHAEGPQTITLHGVEDVVVLGVEEYRTLLSRQPDFRAHLLGGPKVDAFEVERSSDTGRAVDL